MAGSFVRLIILSVCARAALRGLRISLGRKSPQDRVNARVERWRTRVTSHRVLKTVPRWS
eukprot:1689733-Pyramimonas_sp.AAC.1